MSYIVSSIRTPIGSFCGSLAGVDAIDLGVHVVKGVVSAIDSIEIDQMYIGNVLSSGLGQNVAQQVAVKAGLKVPATTINKVCASGLKAVSLSVDSISSGSNCVIAGGIESMSNAPHLLKMRNCRYGSKTVLDSIEIDGLTDAYSMKPMGILAQSIAAKFGIDKSLMDQYSIESNTFAIESRDLLKNEILAMKSLCFDEQTTKFNRTKLEHLPSVFGPITAASSSALADGAAALVIVSEKCLESLNTTAFRILACADAVRDPAEFAIAPADAIQLALKKTILTIHDIDYFEINEAFACVVLANIQLLGIDRKRVNVFGGAVALGHPLGCSGTRILCTLMNVLKTRNARYGCAAICNGGGGATAVIIELQE